MRKKLVRGFIIGVVLLLSTYSQATLLGPASDYNAFSLGEMDIHGSDSQGRLAAGGNIIMSNFGVARLASPSTYSIVSGAGVSFGPGSVKNGGIFAEDYVQLSNYGVYGDVVSNGPVTLNSGSVYGDVIQNAGISGPINFTDASAYLNSVSVALAAMETTGSTSVTPWGAIALTGTENVNIFRLDGNDLNNASSLTFNIGTGNVAIVNVSGVPDGSGGLSNEFAGFGIFGADGKERNILYNFYDSDQLSVHNIGVKGSLLAPGAEVVFYSGNINGTLIADYIHGSGEYHWYRFDHDVPVNPVPEPGTVSLLGIGIAGVVVLRKRVRTKI